MTFEESTLTLGGETRAIKSLDFFLSGEVGKTDKKGETSVVCGEYTFLVTEKSLRYRFKPKGARASKPVKNLLTFADLDALPIVYKNKVTTNNNDISAQSTEEEIKMAEIKLEGKKYPIPANVQKALKAGGVEDAVVELSQFDDAKLKVSGADLAALEKFEKEVIDPIYEEPKANAKGKVENKTEAKPAAETKPAETPAPATGKQEGAPALQTSNLFGGAQTNSGSQGRRPTKTKEQREAERREREDKRRAEQEELKETGGKIEEVRKQLGSVEGTEEAVKAAQHLLLVNGRLPLFRTLVASDTRLKPRLKNHIKANERQLHPNIAQTHVLSQDGKIDEKYALADYSLDFVESNAPQPKGYFIYVPECLMEMNPSNIYVITERELFINAAAANPDASKLNRVIKYVSKTDLVHLLVLLGGTNVKVQEFKPKSNTFEENSPFIHLETRLDKNGQTVYTLRAKDAHGAGIKLSIRKFIPEFTHDTISVSSPDFSAKLTTNALFGRMLFNVSQWTNANKFSQLRQNDQLKFTQDADGDYVYNQFTDSYTVDAYDQNKNSKHTTTVYLPFVKETVSSSGTTRTVFSKSKFNEDGGNYKVALYRRDIEAVGDQINRTKKRTAKSMNNSLTSQLHVQEGLLSLVSGNQINIK